MSTERQTYSVSCVRCPLTEFEPIFVAKCKECVHYLGMVATTDDTVIRCGLGD